MVDTAASSADPLFGHRLGNFTITGRIGQGGMGVVYAAQHATLPTKAAVKVLLEEFARDADLVKRFLDEAHVASSIHDPHVVRVFDAGLLADGRPYLVMELLEGRSVHALIEDGPLPLVRAVKILKQVAGAIATVHKYGIIHRDLKPENVHLGRNVSGEDAAKVLDFGLAKSQGIESGMTTAGTIVGTPDYMSPEQAQGKVLDKRSDIYSFGCVAYAMLTANAPFIADSAIGVLLAHVGTPAPDVRTKRSETPASLASLISRCMGKLPDDRPASMDQVVAELEAIAREVDTSFGATASLQAVGGALPTVGVAATAVSGVAAVTGLGSGIQPTAVSSTGMQAGVATRTQNRLPIIAGAAAVVVLGVGAVVYSQRGAARSTEKSSADSIEPRGAAGAKGSAAESASSTATAPTTPAAPLSEDKNPFKVSDTATVAAGSAIWTSKCVRCHGSRGDGKGSDLPPGIHPKAFSDVVLPPGTLDVYYFGILTHGVERSGGEAMPAFAKKLDVKERWQVVTFLNTLRPKMKVVDVEKELKAGPPPETPTCHDVGAELFFTRCSTCHGEDGTGEGPAAAFFAEPPADLKDGNWNERTVRKGESDLQHVFRIVTTGSGENMGKFSSVSTDDRWAIARFVVSMRAKRKK